MDELSSTCRFARRVALAATICCAATSGYADGPESASLRQSTLRTLLSKGWINSRSARQAEPQSGKATVVTGEKSVELHPRLRVFEVEPPVLTGAPSVTDSRASATTEARPRLVTPAAPKGVATSNSQQTSSAAINKSLGELIKRRTKPIVVPPPVDHSSQIRTEIVPSVNRFDVDQQQAAKVARVETQNDPLARSAAPVKAAAPIRPEMTSPAQDVDVPAVPTVAASTQTSPTDKPAEPSPVAEVEGIAVKAAPSLDPALDISEPLTASTGMIQEATLPIVKVVPEKEQLAPTVTPPSAAAEKANVEAVPDETLVVESAAEVAKPTAGEATTVEVASKPDAEVPAKTALAEILAENSFAVSEVKPSPALPTKSSDTGLQEVTPEPQPALPAAESLHSRRIANDSGFGLLPLKSFGLDAAEELRMESQPAPSLTATIHTTRLREVALESLRMARHRLQRQATHSAKKYALEALQSIIAMRDAQTGGNAHAKKLAAAFDAIRESKDFGGRFGVINENVLKRMVAVHVTTALKGKDVSGLSALEATEVYLAHARECLVDAAAASHEASDALVLLGQIEQQLASNSNTHASSVAVTLQRAAVEIDPESAFGYRELGATLMHQGLVDQAAWALNRSIEIEPTRAGYEKLLDVSRRRGDIDTARACIASLKKPDFEKQIPVRKLSPKEFATTHRPDPAQLKKVQPNPKPEKMTPTEPTKETRISLRSLLPFGRR